MVLSTWWTSSFRLFVHNNHTLQLMLNYPQKSRIRQGGAVTQRTRNSSSHWEWSTQCITIVINNLSKTLAHNCRKNFGVLFIWSKVKVSGHTFLRTDWKRKNHLAFKVPKAKRPNCGKTKETTHDEAKLNSFKSCKRRPQRQQWWPEKSNVNLMQGQLQLEKF